jgi:hypothetical protein
MMRALLGFLAFALLWPSALAEPDPDYPWGLELDTGDRFRCQLISRNETELRIRWRLQPALELVIPAARVKTFERLDPEVSRFPWLLRTRSGESLRVAVDGLDEARLSIVWGLMPEQKFAVAWKDVASLSFQEPLAREPFVRLALEQGERFLGRLLEVDEERLRFTFDPLGEVTIARSEVARFGGRNANPKPLTWQPPGKPANPRARRAEPQLDQLWEDLTHSEQERSFEAYRRFARAGDQALAFISKQLSPAPEDSSRIRELIRKLDDDEFDIREQASSALTDLGELAEPWLRQALRKPQSPEALWRIETALFDGAGAPAATSLQIRRAVLALHILEHIGGDGAHRILNKIAKNRPSAPTTVAARQILERWDHGR